MLLRHLQSRFLFVRTIFKTYILKKKKKIRNNLVFNVLSSRDVYLRELKISDDYANGRLWHIIWASRGILRKCNMEHLNEKLIQDRISSTNLYSKWLLIILKIDTTGLSFTNRISSSILYFVRWAPRHTFLTLIYNHTPINLIVNSIDCCFR